MTVARCPACALTYPNGTDHAVIAIDRNDSGGVIAALLRCLVCHQRRYVQRTIEEAVVARAALEIRDHLDTAGMDEADETPQ